MRRRQRQWVRKLIFIFLVFMIGELSLAGNQIEALEKSLGNIKNDSLLINAYNKLSHEYKEINTEKGLFYGKMALQLAINKYYKYEIAEAYLNLGLNYWRCATYDVALDNYLKGLRIYEELNYKQGIGITYNYIGLIYFTRNQYNKALDYLSKSLEINMALGIEKEIARVNHNMGLVYTEMKKYQDALNHHNLSLKSSILINDSSLMAFNLCFMGRCYIFMNKLDSAYLYLKDSYELFNKLSSLNDIAMVSNQFALYYMNAGKYTKSIELAQKGLDLGERIGNQFMKLEALEIISKSYYKTGEFKKAYDISQQVNTLNEILKNEDNIQKIAQQETQYEYEKKMRSMEIRQQNELYVSKIKLYSVIVLTSLIAIIAFLIFRLYRDRNARSISLEAMNREIVMQSEELAELNSKLTELNSTKDKFFSIISHDLKSPFSGFLHYSRMLNENYNEFTENEINEISKNLRDSAENLYQLLENLLEWSKMQRGKTSYNPDECTLDHLVAQNISILNEYARKKEINISSNIDPDLKVLADVPMLNTVIRNLLSNAMKFTERGGNIDVNASYLENRDEIEVSVKDSGIGMNEIMLNQLFQIDKKISRNGTEGEPSTGLGLILCKEFIDKHDGKIWAESKVGAGTTFFFTLSKF